MQNDLERALALLGPLEGRIMRAVWTGAVHAPFVVRDVHALIPELAYTTLMTTLNRLAHKDLLAADRTPGHRAHTYRPTGTSADHLARASRHEVEVIIERFGESALAAFATHLHVVPGAKHEELRRVAQGPR